MWSPLLAHLTGDYVVQSSWMAERKVDEVLPAVAHAVTYTACFLPLTRSPRALAVIGGTHFVIDHWRLAKRLGWLKNQAAPAPHRYPWLVGQSNAGYDANVPVWLSTWLMIVADNTAHMALNAWALERL